MHMSDDSHSIRIMSYNILADLLVCCWAHNTINTQISSAASFSPLMKLLIISLGMSPMLRDMSCMAYFTVLLLQAHEHADELYRACPKWCISWQQRGPGIMAEILHWAPDIGCLQEVDHPEEFREFLQEHG